MIVENLEVQEEESFGIWETIRNKNYEEGGGYKFSHTYIIGTSPWSYVYILIYNQ